MLATLRGSLHKPSSSSSVRADTQAWLDAASGTYTAAERDALDLFLANLDSAGVLLKLDRLWIPFFAKNLADGLRDFRGRFNATAVNSPIHTFGRGFTFNGTNSYVNSGFNPGDGGSYQYTQNSAHLGAFARSPANSTLSSVPTLVGARATNNSYRSVLLTATLTETGSFSVNQPTSDTSTAVLARTSSYYLANRSGSSATQAYRAKATAAGSTTSAAIASLVFFVGARNNGGSPDQYSNATIGAFHFGGSLTADEWDMLVLELERLRLTILYPNLGALRSDTNAWISAASGIYSDFERRALNDYLTNLAGDAILAKLDRLWLLQFGKNRADALRDIIALSEGTEVNSPTFTAGEGFTGDTATDRYINTNFVPSSGINYTQNDASIWVFARTTPSTSASNRTPIGARISGSSQQSFLLATSPTALGGRLNQNSATSISLTNGYIGLLGVSRSDSSVTTRINYASATGSTTSSAPTDHPFFLLTLNGNGAPAGSSFRWNGQLAAAGIGSNLDSSQWIALLANIDLFHASIQFVPGT